MYPAFPAGFRRKTYGVSDSPSEFTFDQVKLGMHLPSEQAVKEVLRAAQACGLDVENCNKLDVVRRFKAILRAKVRQVGRPEKHVVEYPTDPMLLEGWEEIYGDDRPCGQSSSLSQRGEKYNVPLRRTRKSAQELVPASSSATQNANKAAADAVMAACVQQIFPALMPLLSNMGQGGLQNLQVFPKGTPSVMPKHVPALAAAEPPDADSVAAKHAAPLVRFQDKSGVSMKPAIQDREPIPIVNEVPKLSRSNAATIETDRESEEHDPEKESREFLRAKMKRPAASMMVMKKPAALGGQVSFKYTVPKPDKVWKGKRRDNWTSKHYHSARNAARDAGLTEEECKEVARKAAREAGALWDAAQ